MTKVDAAFKLMVGAALLIFSLSALIYSTNPATASNSDKLYDSGRYQIEYEATFDPTSSKMYYYAIIMDTQTGKSTAYYAGNNGWKKSASGYQLPSSPVD